MVPSLALLVVIRAMLETFNFFSEDWIPRLKVAKNFVERYFCVHVFF